MGTYKGIEYIVFLNDHLGTFCGYIRLPNNHKFVKLLSKKKWFRLDRNCPRHYHYDYDAVPLGCHGGLTFGTRITKQIMPKYPQGFSEGWWVGWDYAHAGDFVPMSPFAHEKHWQAADVEKECKRVITQLKKYGN